MSTITDLTQNEIIKGIPFKFKKDSTRTFIMRNEDWNDFGYYTYYTLNMYLPNGPFPFGVAAFRIIFRGQKVGESPSRHDRECIAFVQNIESAEGILYFLSPEEREILQKKLKICYEPENLSLESVFKYSVLRGSNEFLFKQMQRKIKELIHSPIDFKSIVLNNKDQLFLYLKSL